MMVDAVLATAVNFILATGCRKKLQVLYLSMYLVCLFNE